MTTIMPDSERMKKAVRWVSEQRQADPEQDPLKLADQAIFKFDLSPQESEFLVQFVTGRAGQKP